MKRPIWLVLALVFMFGAVPAATPSTAQAPLDSLGEGSPRGALYRYLTDARQAKWSEAARYLDLSEFPEDERKTQGPLLARELKVVLDRTIWIDFDTISNQPGGTPPPMTRLTTSARNAYLITPGFYIPRGQV